MSQILDYAANNWHKFGVGYLLLKEIKDIYKFIANIKGIQDTLIWLINKIKTIFNKTTAI